MRLKRSAQFDESAPPWLHCVSRCVRRAFLCGDGFEHRKAWIERRLRILRRCMGLEIGAYAVMSNHLHVVVRPRPEWVQAWTAGEIARAWWCLRQDVDPADLTDASGQVVAVDQAQVDALAADAAFITVWRQRLGSVSWMMKSLKEPLSRMANREDDCTGAFWEGRFTSIPLLDVKAIVACMAYVDLNPIRAKLAATPETSAHTSVRARIEHRAARQRAQALRAQGARAAAATTLRQAQVEPQARREGTPAQRQDPQGEPAYPSWLTPVSAMTSTAANDPGFTLDWYLTLVEATGRLVRAGKRGTVDAELPGILSRLDCDVAGWMQTVATPQGLRGAALGGVSVLAAEAKRRGLAWLQRRTALFAGGSRSNPAA
jgi:REP element-mobilizing transposase RayT